MFANANPTLKAREVCVEIVVTGRNVEVPEHFRVHVAEKVARLERYDHKMIGIEVELFHERNRRQLKSCQRVEITGRGCECVARAEACAQDFYGALDAAIAKLESQLRRSHDRRRVHGKRGRLAAAAEAGLVVGGTGTGTAVLDEVETTSELADAEAETPAYGVPAPREHQEYLDDPDPMPGRVVRRKSHTDNPMSVQDALARMELVGHDFYLFADAESGKPSVVYRRRGYDYGVITLAR